MCYYRNVCNFHQGCGLRKIAPTLLGRGAAGAKTAPTPPGSVIFKRNIKCSKKGIIYSPEVMVRNLLVSGAFSEKKTSCARRKLLFHYNLV